MVDLGNMKGSSVILSDPYTVTGGTLTLAILYFPKHGGAVWLKDQAFLVAS